MSFHACPAIDVRGGHVVRLRQGDYEHETRYGDDPFVLAQAYARAGARWLHLVDLDGARDGRYGLDALLQRLNRELGLQVQTGGGIRDRSDIQRVLEAGAQRVVLGSVAVREPSKVVSWMRDLGEDAVTIALDARCDDEGTWQLPVHGWLQASGSGLFDLLDRYAAHGLRHLLCTDIDRDGMLSGPNVSLYRDILARAPGVRLQASGGIRDVPDIRAVREAGCSSVVLGKALLEGRVDLREALAC